MDHLERYLCLSKHPKCHEDGGKFGRPRKKTPRPCNNVLGELLEVIDAGIVELAENGKAEVHTKRRIKRSTCTPNDFRLKLTLTLTLIILLMRIFVNEKQATEGVIKVKKVDTDDQTADIFTESLNHELFAKYSNPLGLIYGPTAECTICQQSFHSRNLLNKISK